MRGTLLAAALAITLPLASAPPARGQSSTALPHAVFAAPPLRTVHAGDDDLLTAGLGLAGLRAAAPGFALPLRPTVAELRRRAVWQNYRGLQDVSEIGGFGRLFGPLNDARAPGIEFLAAIRTPHGEGITTLMLQIPQQFAPASPCLLVVAASGSRGIYGGLPIAGEWGFRRGCAIAYTDKGSGFWDVDRDTGVRIDGQLTADRGDPLLSFAPPASRQNLITTDSAHRMLLLHANSGSNPESEWGLYVLQALDGALQLLNQEYPAQRKEPFTTANTLVIAVGISNGGGAVLRAAEADRAGWIDGVVAGEPNVAVDEALPRLAIETAGQTRNIVVRSLYDYVTLSAQLQPCATLAEPAETLPLSALRPALQAQQVQWCGKLHEAALVSGDDSITQAADARRQLLAAGLETGGLRMGLVNLQTAVLPAIAGTYAAAYARSGAGAQPCGISFAALDAQGLPRALSGGELALVFSDSTGIAPTAGIAAVRAGGSAQDLATMNCLRGLLPQLHPGLHDIQMSARTRARPVIVLHGRDDGLIAVNHSSRAWFALRQRQPHGDAVRYYEITHAQHFDAFIGLPGMRGAYVPMQPYVNSALDMLWGKLTQGRDPPPSQVWRSRPTAQPLQAADLGALKDNPAAERILLRRRTLVIPE